MYKIRREIDRFFRNVATKAYRMLQYNEYQSSNRIYAPIIIIIIITKFEFELTRIIMVSERAAPGNEGGADQ